MFFFGKNQKEESHSAPVSAPKPAAEPKKIVDADDFFKDMGRKPKAAEPAEPEASVDVPVVTGLREAPEPVLPSNMNDLNTDELSIGGLRDKSAEDDGAYHGNMNDIDEASLDMSSLDRKKSDEVTAEPEPSPAAKPASFLDPDDFFKDMGRKAKPAEVKETVDIPVITGLREAPEVVLPSNMNDLDTGALTTDGLRDKSAEDDGAYHGNMNDIDKVIDTSSLRPEN